VSYSCSNRDKEGSGSGAIREQVCIVTRARADGRRYSPFPRGWGWFPRVGLAKAHAHTTSVFVNELDTTGFQATAHHFERCATRLMRAGLELAHGHDAHPCSFREFLLAPVKKAASGATLR
jgi:hypothetical protein